MLFNLRNILTPVLFAVIVGGNFAKANPTPINVTDSKGMTCLEWMTKVVKPALDKDETAPFKVVDQATAKKVAAEDFDPSVIQKMNRIFKDGENGLNELIGALAGQEFTPETFAAAIAKKLEDLKLVDTSKIGLDGVVASPFLAIISGAGVRIVWTEGNTSAVPKQESIEEGYKKGETDDAAVLAKAVKSGRGFGISGDRKALDASDVFYLKGLDAYLEKNKDASDFFKLIIDVLTQCDTSQYKNLNDDGRAVATDFFTVYVAEQTRHLMAKLKAHPWENDLAEVTMLSAYVTESKQIFKNGKHVLEGGSPVDFFAVGKGGSGIGETRKDRRALQQSVTKAVRKLKPELTANIEKLIGSVPDVFQGLMEYLNNPANEKDIVKNSADLNKAVGDFLTYIRENAGAITKEIQSS